MYLLHIDKLEKFVDVKFDLRIVLNFVDLFVVQTSVNACQI